MDEGLSCITDLGGGAEAEDIGTGTSGRRQHDLRVSSRIAPKQLGDLSISVATSETPPHDTRTSKGGEASSATITPQQQPGSQFLTPSGSPIRIRLRRPASGRTPGMMEGGAGMVPGETRDGSVSFPSSPAHPASRGVGRILVAPVWVSAPKGKLNQLGSCGILACRKIRGVRLTGKLMLVRAREKG